MRTYSLKKTLQNVLKITTIAAASLALANATYAHNSFSLANGKIGLLDCAHWYIGGNLGVSHANDRPFTNSNDHVDENGPGWNVNSGYQFFHIYQAIFGGELGYSSYADSREYAPGSITVGRTEHYSIYLAATGQLPLVYNFSALAKLGAANSYARKNAFPGNFSRSANPFSLYYGFGLMYNVTPRAALVTQWARDRGNSTTGSMDLYTLGVQVTLA